MGFGAIIASGDSNELLAEGLMGCITEVRVEQSLDEPARFAIRFEEDISEGEPFIMKAPQLQPEQMITVAVQVGDAMTCLVRGPITDVKCSIALGGPGSWYEIRGRDRRVELDRQCFRHAWVGRGSEAVQTILEGHEFEAAVQETTKVYDEETGTLNQRSTDLEFVNRIARQNNLHFWITYACELDGLAPTRGKLKVDETANVESSPKRPKDDAGEPLSVEQIQLVPSVDLGLRVNVDRDRCQNVTAFDMDLDVERPNEFVGTALNDRDLREDKTSAQDPQPAVRKGGRGLADVTGRQRDVCITTAGDTEELQPRAESALTDAGWFVSATASTTAHMLGGVVMPHDVVSVDGLGPKHSGAYQIKTVTHVITAGDHHMDLELRRNAIGGG